MLIWMQSPNYIKKVIGDRNLTIDSDGKQTENGDYRNYSSFIRVDCKEEGSFPITVTIWTRKILQPNLCWW